MCFDILMDVIMNVLWGWGVSFGFSLIIFISFCDMIFYAILCDFGHIIYVHVDLMNSN